MVKESDLTHEALRNAAQEGQCLREYISASRAAFDATNEEVSEAKAMAAVAQAKFVDESDSTFLGTIPIQVGMVLSFSFISR